MDLITIYDMACKYVKSAQLNKPDETFIVTVPSDNKVKYTKFQIIKSKLIT